MGNLKLRDRDSIVTREEMIFRIYGYSHPPKAYICDPEYAPANTYQSRNPRAFRSRGKRVYYKFYADEGLQFIRNNYPRYAVWVAPIGHKLVGIREEDIWKIRQPDKALQVLLRKESKDSLLEALHSLIDLTLQRSSLSQPDFGVFGSMLNGFYHPDFSDLDLIIYGADRLERLGETLDVLYRENDSPLRNEFDDTQLAEKKHWQFSNYSLKEYIWHQKRKRIYGLFNTKGSRRKIKVEFEPVKRWNEIQNEYEKTTRIRRKGWIKLQARVVDAHDAPFLPSVYQIEPIKIIEGNILDDLQRVVSFVEEFRLQAQEDELVEVEGNLEEVFTRNKTFHQMVLTYCPRYYEQTLKVAQ